MQPRRNDIGQLVETAVRIPISCTIFSRYSGNDEVTPIFAIARMAWLDGAAQMDVFSPCPVSGHDRPPPSYHHSQAADQAACPDLIYCYASPALDGGTYSFCGTNGTGR